MTAAMKLKMLTPWKAVVTNLDSIFQSRDITLPTKVRLVKANRVLPRERTGRRKHPLPATQEKTVHMDITKWSTPKSD